MHSSASLASSLLNVFKKQKPGCLRLRQPGFLDLAVDGYVTGLSAFTNTGSNRLGVGGGNQPSRPVVFPARSYWPDGPALP